MQRTGGALGMTGGARDRTGVTLQSTGGALERDGGAKGRTGVALVRTGGAMDRLSLHYRGLPIRQKELAVRYKGPYGFSLWSLPPHILRGH